MNDRGAVHHSVRPSPRARRVGNVLASYHVPGRNARAGADGGEEEAPEIERAHARAADDRVERGADDRAADGDADAQARVVPVQVEHLADDEADEQTDENPADDSDEHVRPPRVACARVPCETGEWRGSPGGLNSVVDWPPLSSPPGGAIDSRECATNAKCR